MRKSEFIDRISAPDPVHGAPSGALRTGLERALRGVPEDNNLTAVNVDVLQRAVDVAYEAILRQTRDGTVVRSKLERERDRVQGRVPSILLQGVAEPRTLSSREHPTDGPDDRSPHAGSD